MLGGACSQRGHRASGFGARPPVRAPGAGCMAMLAQRNHATLDIVRGSCCRYRKARI